MDYINLPFIYLWLIGSVFIMTMFEPDEESGPRPLVLLSIFWPIITLYTVAHELWHGDKE